MNFLCSSNLRKKRRTCKDQPHSFYFNLMKGFLVPKSFIKIVPGKLKRRSTVRLRLHVRFQHFSIKISKKSRTASESKREFLRDILEETSDDDPCGNESSASTQSQFQHAVFSPLGLKWTALDRTRFTGGYLPFSLLDKHSSHNKTSGHSHLFSP